LKRKQLKRFILNTIINQLAGIALSLVLAAMAGTTRNFEINIRIALTFTNCIGYIYYAMDLLYTLFLKYRIEIKFLRVLIYSTLILISIFLGSQLSISIANSILNATFVPISDTVKSILMLINVILVFFVVALFIIYRDTKKQIERKIRENENLKNLQEKARMSALQAKINPHFLFNTLNTILDLVYVSPEKVEKVVLSLSDIYRKILYSSENEKCFLSEEMDLVRRYLDIEKIRIGDRLDYHINIDDKLKNMKIVPLLIEPIVENSVIHGIGPKKNGGMITVNASLNKQKAFFEIIDNGVGLSSKNFKMGFGINNVNERLKLFYGEEAGLKFTETLGGGLTVRFEIMLELLEE
jgi:two-component system LytT family sensor kinase